MDIVAESLQRAGQGAPNFDCREGGRVEVEVELLLAAQVGFALGVDREFGRGLEAFDIGERDCLPAEVGAARFERQCAGGGVGNEAHRDLVEIGLGAVPILRIALQRDVAAAHPAFVHKGASADRGAVVRVGQDVGAFVQVLGHDRRFGRRECRQQVGRRLREDEDGGVRIRGFDGRHVGEGAATARMVLLERLDREGHVGRGEGFSVVPLDAFAQLEAVLQAVFADRPGRGQ